MFSLKVMISNKTYLDKFNTGILKISSSDKKLSGNTHILLIPSKYYNNFIYRNSSKNKQFLFFQLSLLLIESKIKS